MKELLRDAEPTEEVPIECLQGRQGTYAARLLFLELTIALVPKLPLDKLPGPDTTFTGDKTDDSIREGLWLRYYRTKMLESRIKRDDARYQEEINRFSRIRFGKSEHPDQVSADTWKGLEILAGRRKDAAQPTRQMRPLLKVRRLFAADIPPIQGRCHSCHLCSWAKSSAIFAAIF